MFVNYVIFPKIKVKNKRYLKLPARKPKRQSLAPTDPIILGFPYRWRQIGLGIGWVCDPSLSFSCQEMRLINYWFSFKRPYYILISKGGMLRGVGGLAINTRQNKQNLRGLQKNICNFLMGWIMKKSPIPMKTAKFAKVGSWSCLAFRFLKIPTSQSRAMGTFLGHTSGLVNDQ